MSPSTLKSIRDVILLTVAGTLLLFAQSAYWLNQTIFNKQNFTSIVTPIITSEQSRQAISTTIVSRALENNPIVYRLIGNNVTSLVTGLLGTDLAQQMTTTVIDKSYSYLTTKDPKPIAIDLTTIKAPLETITDILSARGQDLNIDPSAIPDSITLFDPSDLPDVYGYSVLVLWLGPVFWITSLLLAVIYLYVGRKQYARRVYTIGGVVILVSGIGLLVGPLLPPPIIAQVPIPALRGVVQELIAGLLAPFTQQMFIMLGITTSVLIVFNLRFSILHGAQWLVRKTSEFVSRDKTKTTPKSEPAVVTPKTKTTKTVKSEPKKTQAKKTKK